MSDAELLLLTLPLLLDVAKFYTSGDERAKRARRTINKNQNRTKPFHASIWVDLLLLHGALAKYTITQFGSSEEQSEPFGQLLQIIDEDFVKTSDVASVTSESSVRFFTALYLLIKHLTNMPRRPRMIWSRTRGYVSF